MKELTGQTLGTTICAALGIDPSQVVEITLRCRSTKLAEIVVCMRVNESVGDVLVTELGKYRLVENDDSPV